MKKLILLLLFIPLASFGQETFEDPEFVETTLLTNTENTINHLIELY